MYEFYVVTHQYGSDLLSWDELVQYCKSWWNDYNQLSDINPDELTDDDVVSTYFDFQAEYGYSEWYTYWTLDNLDMLEKFKVKNTDNIFTIPNP